MKCQNCGKELEQDVRFCPMCGTMTGENQEQKDDKTIENSSENVADEIKKDENTSDSNKNQKIVSCENKSISAEGDGVKNAQKALMELKKLKLKKPIPKLLRALAVAGTAVLLVVIVACLFKSCSPSESFNADNYPLIYCADDEIKYIGNGEKRGKVIASEDDFYDNDKYTVQITEDGKYIFFGTNPDGYEFDLCVREFSKKDERDNKTIVEGISEFKISPDGKTIFYIKNDNLYRVGMNGKNPVKLGKDVDGFIVSEDYRAVLYENYNDDTFYYSTGVDKIHIKVAEETDNKEIEDIRFVNGGEEIVIITEDTDDGDYTLYLCGTGKKSKPEKQESGFDSYEFSDDGQTLYLAKKGKLYVKEGKKKAKQVEGITADVSALNSVLDDGKNIIYAVSQKEADGEYIYDLYHVDGKNATIVIEDIKDKYLYPGKIVSVSEYDYEAFEEIKEFYLRVDYDKYVKTELPRENGRTVEYKFTENNLYALENVDEENGMGDLVKYEFTDTGINLDKGVVIAEDVIGFDTDYSDLCDRETVVIMHDSNEYSVYTGGKKAVEIPADVEYFDGVYRDGTMLIETDYNRSRNTITLAKFNGKKLTKIAEDVVSYKALDENSFFYINEDEQLVYNKGKLGKDTVVDEDVDFIVNPRDFVVTNDGFTADYNRYSLYFN